MTAGKLIAYGPVTDVTPSVPDILIIEDNEMLLSLRRNDGRRLSQEAFESQLEKIQLKRLDKPPFWRPGCWIAVESTGVIWFNLNDENRWREQKSQQLLIEAQALKDDPLKTLALLRASAELARVKFDGFISLLESNKQKQESLIDVFKRLPRT